ncbi:MAG: DUF4350 domain-containing protein [Gemmatimonadetes bacterium]|nr:DUF4350 domain-containing protein [Gemmatimonadota bacterium]
MGNRRNVMVLAAVLFALAAMALFVRPSADGDRDDPRASTFLTGPSGVAALYLLMDELGIPAERQLRGWSADTARHALVVLAPSQAATPREMQALRTWIEDGGTLVYGAGGALTVTTLLGLETRPTRLDTLGALASVRWRGSTAFSAATHPWTAGVDSVTGFMRAFRARSSALGDDSAEVLMRTADGEPTVVSFRIGTGRVIAWSDATVLGNGALRTGGAALLFARAAHDIAAGGELRFDEYHHGYREAKPLHVLGAVLTRTGGGRALLQAVVACLALLLFAGSRFGAPVREHRERRRSPIEHMQALAGAYERAGARAPARRLLLAGMERQLGRRVFSAGALPPAALDGTDAGRRLKQEWERGDDGDLAELAGALDDFVLEVRRWK